MFGIIIDLNEKTDDVQICDFGHSLTYLFRENQFLKLTYEKTNFPLGISSDFLPEVNRLKLKPNDILISITDGVTEQVNIKREEYSIEKLCESIFVNKTSDLQTIKSEIIKDIDAHKDQCPQFDDITILLIKYN